MAADLSSSDGSGKPLMVVVVAMDESEQSFHALEWVLEHMGPSFLAPYKLLLLHSKMFTTITPNQGLIVGGDIILNIEKGRDKEIEVFMNKALGLCQQKQIVAETIVKPGDPRDVICETVEDLNPSLLVVGSHGYGTIKRALLGSVSDYCAHHVKCPILIVKKPHKACHGHNHN